MITFCAQLCHTYGPREFIALHCVAHCMQNIQRNIGFMCVCPFKNQTILSLGLSEKAIYHDPIVISLGLVICLALPISRVYISACNS